MFALLGPFIYKINIVLTTTTFPKLMRGGAGCGIQIYRINCMSRKVE